MDYFSVIQSALRLIESRAGGGCDGLAAELGYSEAHLRDVFARQVGVPLRRYILRRKVLNAAFDALYSSQSLTDIAFKYGFESYDTFTRAFRRVCGLTPSEFRKRRPRMERRSMGGGMYGVFIAAREETYRGGMLNMSKHTDEHSTILYGVPKVCYGTFDGAVTPYPICLKACANYLGEDIDYADAIVGCGAAFRFAWNKGCWDGGNVDVCHTFEECKTDVYLNGMKAFGRSYRVYGGGRDREAYRTFITEALKEGLPVIAAGVVGPPEMGVITGYRDDGNVLMGWSVFQDIPEYAATVHIDESGYYITDRWWDNGIGDMLVMDKRVGERWTDEQIISEGLRAMEPRQEGAYYKGLAAYAAWREDIGSESEFENADALGDALGYANELRPEGADEVILPKIIWRHMCHCDATDCLYDGRRHAARYFASRAGLNPRYAEVARRFNETAEVIARMSKTLGGWQRDESSLRLFSRAQTREVLCKLIAEAEAADTNAYEALKKLV